VSADAIIAGLETAPPVPGRFESIESDGIVAVVDYAHTPAGLSAVLHAARAAAKLPPRPDRARSGSAGRLITVFGCGGERDRGKRPAMGAVANDLADLVILTSDNPRTEDPMVIIGEIRAGMAGNTSVTVEPDRRTAIGLAIDEARPGDIVVVAGKGHETTQQFADRTVRFDDREVLRAEFARRGSISGSDGPVPT
jgi:UDP-N-acetylmuramoyl-L-alanyl-D-glutamate--2,6-diaminopimelate ligase